MLRAVENACGYVEVGIRTAPNIGKGNGPINHFHGSLIVEKPKGSNNPKEQKNPKHPLRSTLTTQLWHGGSVDGSGAEDDETLNRQVTEVLNELYDQTLEGREDSPQIGDRFFRSPPRVISKEEAQMLKEAQEADKEAEKVERAERAAKKAAEAVRKAAEAAEKAAEAAKTKRRSTKGLAEKPPRLARKAPPTKFATAATQGLAKKPVRRTAKAAQQQTVMEAGEEEDIVKASKDASKKVGEFSKNHNSGVPIAIPSNSRAPIALPSKSREPIALPSKSGTPIALPSNSVNRSAKPIQQKTSQKPWEKNNADEEDSDETEVVSKNVVTKQLAGPSQALAPKRARRLRLISNSDNLKETGKAGDGETGVVDVDEYTAAKNDALKKDDELARERSGKKVKQLKRKAGDMLPNGTCLFGTSTDAPWIPKRVKR